ncbi:hypothetical protein HY623_01365 [Candidatus Uhrbacteria bacterium]|nr:hypothetical protein [Candidatus Uhrbacteria bacterium]
MTREQEDAREKYANRGEYNTGYVRQRLRAYIASLIVFFSQAQEVSAKIEYQFDKQQGSYELIYQENESERPVHFLPVPIAAIGEHENGERIRLPFFDRLRKIDITEGGVNYSIKDPIAFRNFIENELDRYVRALNIHGDIKPQDLIQITALITKNNMLPTSDERLLDSINHTPLDELLMGVKRGVCRHYAAAFETVAETIIEITQSKYLQNIIVDEVGMADVNHAWNVVYHLTQNNGAHFINMGFIDTTIKPHGTFSDLGEIEKRQGDVKNFRTIYLNQLYYAVNPEDRIAVVRDSVLLAENEKEKLQYVTELAFTFLSQVKELYQRKENGKARQVFEEADKYFNKWYEQYSKDDTALQHVQFIRTIMISIYSVVADNTPDAEGKVSVYKRALLWSDIFNYALADAYLKSGNQDEARAIYVGMLENINDSRVFEKVFGFFNKLNESENVEKTLSAYKKYLEKRPVSEQAFGFTILADAYEVLGNIEQKLLYLKKAFFCDDERAERRMERGERYADSVLAQGDAITARKIYDEMFKIYKKAKKDGKITIPFKRQMPGKGFVEVFAEEDVYKEYLKEKLGQPPFLHINEAEN